MATVQEVKKRMKGIKRMRNNVRHLEEMRDVAWSKITRITPVSEETGIHASQDSDRIAQYVAYMEETDKEIAGLMREIRSAARMVNELRAFVPEHPEYSAVLYCYYIDDMTWDMTAKVIHYSRRQAIRVHGDALVALAEMMSKEAAG